MKNCFRSPFYMSKPRNSYKNVTANERFICLLLFHCHREANALLSLLPLLRVHGARKVIHKPTDVAFQLFTIPLRRNAFACIAERLDAFPDFLFVQLRPPLHLVSLSRDLLPPEYLVFLGMQIKVFLQTSVERPAHAPATGSSLKQHCRAHAGHLRLAKQPQHHAQRTLATQKRRVDADLRLQPLGF